ncbi:MAG: hypothetical protein KAI24_01845 [Planctomycetes bacterium]|nr:hypothetical protein [Planctomycetota bacterium]
MIKLNLSPERRVLRQFAWFGIVGLPFLTAFVVKTITGLAWTDAALWSHLAVLVVLGVAVVALMLFELGVELLAHALFALLSIVAIPIGFVLSHVLIALVYYLVLTPIALVFRVMGRDVIGKKLDPEAKSYWHERAGKRPAASYFKLY